MSRLMTPSARRNGLLLAILALLLLSPAAFAAEGKPDPQALKKQLAPIYQQLKLDPQFDALRQQLDGQVQNREVVDRYLSYLPLSPLEMYELEMSQRHFETILPEPLLQWHRRWIELHEKQARELYGDEEVDTWLAGEELVQEIVEDSAVIPPKMATVATNRNVAYNFALPPTSYQGEIQVAANPNNRQQIVAASNTWITSGGCASGIQSIFYSSDGGQTWGNVCAPNETAYGLSCPNFLFGSDPAVTWNANGEVFLEHMMLCTADFQNIRFAIVVARSSNGGSTWTGQGIVKNSWPTINVVEDKNFYAIDNHPNSPFFGRHYTCWDRNNNEKSAYSTDNGVTWTEVNLPTTPSSGTGFPADLSCELEVQKNGTVHVIYDTLTCLGQFCNNEQQFYSQSTNGGVTWSAPVLVRDFNMTGFSSTGTHCPNAQNSRCIGPFGAIAIDNTGGPCDGNLYVAYTDFGVGGHANQADVWLTRSTNNGVTWGAPVKINDDGLIDRTQFHPFVQVDPFTGYPVVGWHDARNDPQNRAIDFYVARSIDCGVSFQTNIQASQPSTEFNNSTISSSNLNTASNPNANPNQYGEYLGLDAQAGKAYMAWTDTRHYFPSSLNSQRENLGFTVVDFTGPYALSGPSPGPAGVNNTWTISGGTPTQTNFLIYGLTAGSVAVPGCPGVTVGIQDINILTSGPANSNGDFTYSLFIPASLSGVTVLFQSVELSTCEVSSLITHTF